MAFRGEVAVGFREEVEVFLILDQLTCKKLTFTSCCRLTESTWRSHLKRSRLGVLAMNIFPLPLILFQNFTRALSKFPKNPEKMS